MAQRSSSLIRVSYEDIADEIVQCLDRWVAAISLGGPGPVTELYEPDAVLNATFYPTPLTTMGERLEYFTDFTANKNLRAVVDESYVKALGPDAGKIDGVYTFSYEDEDDKTRTVKARFTFIFEREPGGEWLIVSHHSSQCPEPKYNPSSLTAPSL